MQTTCSKVYSRRKDGYFLGINSREVKVTVQEFKEKRLLPPEDKEAGRRHKYVSLSGVMHKSAHYCSHVIFSTC